MVMPCAHAGSCHDLANGESIRLAPATLEVFVGSMELFAVNASCSARDDKSTYEVYCVYIVPGVGLSKL